MTQTSPGSSPTIQHTKRKPHNHITLYALAWRCLSAARQRSSAYRLAEPSRRQAPNTSRASDKGLSPDGSLLTVKRHAFQGLP
ncbi:hypothetical protein DEO72_LG10g3239 [Vigna unguiculata]|uniref:Uncharacterized protein n=1 Tax=Vigna unguiculata TaxID=3917 RepID=A0A4D6NDS0_VIGUN|nr:hypothetical protein DEO72_LG10g3239 [Vigna unguiculata]